MKISTRLIAILAFSVVSVSSFAGNGNSLAERLFPTRDFSFSPNNKLALQPPGGGEEDAFGEQKIVMTFGYGFGNLAATLFNAFNDELNYTVKVLGPLHFRGEVGLSETVGVGLSVNHISVSGRWDGDSSYYYKLTYTSTSYLLRLNFHFGTTGNLDPYFGIGAGYKSSKWTDESNDPNWSEGSLGGIVPFGMEMTIGIRYYFTPNIGLYTELGVCKSIMQGGLAFAF